MGADIYDWERVHGKGSYQDLVDGGCSGGRHQAGCSHGEPAHVWPAEAALAAAWEATKGMRIDAGPPHDTVQRTELLVAALQAAWGAVGERGEKAEAKLAAITDACRSIPTPIAERILAIIGGEEGHSATCTDCGGQYADEESGAYLFTSREGLERHLHADRWQADPVLCPACQPPGVA